MVCKKDFDDKKTKMYVLVACDEVPSDEHICHDTGFQDTLANKATLFCKKVLSDKRFAVCRNVSTIRCKFKIR